MNICKTQQGATDADLVCMTYIMPVPNVHQRLENPTIQEHLISTEQ